MWVTIRSLHQMHHDNRTVEATLFSCTYACPPTNGTKAWVLHLYLVGRRRAGQTKTTNIITSLSTNFLNPTSMYNSAPESNSAKQAHLNIKNDAQEQKMCPNVWGGIKSTHGPDRTAQVPDRGTGAPQGIWDQQVRKGMRQSWEKWKKKIFFLIFTKTLYLQFTQGH